MKYIDQLKNKLDKADLWHKTIFLKRYEYLKVNGSTNTNLYYVVSGSLRIFFEDEYEEQIIRLGYTHNFIVALDTFLSNKPSELYIQALKKCELKMITKKTFLDLIAQKPKYGQLWQKVLEQLLYEQMEREKDILIYSPRKRYQRVLARSPHLFQEIPNKYIASYLRMSPETLSRLKKR